MIFAFVLFSKSKGQESLKLPRISLLGVDGKTYTQNSFSNYQNIAVIFYSNHCRVSQKFEKLIIYDFWGNEINSYQYSDVDHGIDVRNLSSGLYLFNILFKDELVTKKIIIKNE